VKHTCQADSTRGGSRAEKLRRLHAARALAAAAAIAGGTQAYGVPIRYDNPPGAEHFNWIPTGTTGINLDVVLPASGQPVDGSSLSSFGQNVNSTFGRITGRQTGAELQVGGYSTLFLVGVDVGSVIPSGAPWNFKGYSYYTGYGTQLPDNQQTYLGVRFNLGSGSQFGWVGVVRNGRELDAFAWGYETEPGVPVGVGTPEPGTLAALALGAAVLSGRRRR
jgi:hypothetical protein